MRFTRSMAVLQCLMALALPVAAQTFPAKPIHLVVPFASGSSDAVARVLAPRLAEVLGQSVVVDNKPGAGTLIGTRHVAQSAPDGYTVLLAAPSVLTNALAYKNPGYSMADFTAVAPVMSQPFILLVKAGLPVKNLADLVTHAKTRPGALNAASLGPSSVTTLSLERFKATAGIDTVSVPYAGGGPAQMALLGGFVDMFMDGAVNTLPQAKSPQLRMLGITSEQRSPLLPQVPTFKEQGFSDLVVRSWTGMFVPAKTPEPVVRKLRAAMVTVLAQPQMQQALQGMGLDLWREPAEDFPAYLREEALLWEKDVRRANLQLE